MTEHKDEIEKLQDILKDLNNVIVNVEQKNETIELTHRIEHLKAFIANKGDLSSICFSPNGLVMHILDTEISTIFQFNLETPREVTSSVLNAAFIYKEEGFDLDGDIRIILGKDQND